MGDRQETDSGSETEIKKEWLNEIYRLAFSATLHPLEYSRILIQLGYEPIAPRPARTLFGRPALGLPNILEYMGFIRKRSGVLGLYRGLTARLCGTITNGYVFTKVTETWDVVTNANEHSTEESENDGDKFQDFARAIVRDTIGKTTAIIASHPFQVITVRTVAQFIGGENQYSMITTLIFTITSTKRVLHKAYRIKFNQPFSLSRSLLSSFREIYKEDGIAGFFAGLVPRLLGELFTLWLSQTLILVIGIYLNDKDLAGYVNASVGFIASAITYPFVVVSNVMAVNNCGLAAGAPPCMPIYDSWTHCWQQLKVQKQLKRGSSVIWRYYQGPYVLEGDRHRVVDLKSFKPPKQSSN